MKVKRAISKKSTNIMKFFAIMMVMTGHYYRYAEVIFLSGLLKSIGYFGAALFAFLSGYGTYASYASKGISDSGRWIRDKIGHIYFPFLFVSMLSVFFVYNGETKDSIILRLLLNTDDFSMWYIPYILVYNVMFLVVVKMNEL